MRVVSKFTQQDKHKHRRWPDPLALLVRMEALEPGKLASWLRAHPPTAEPQRPHRAVFINVVHLRRIR